MKPRNLIPELMDDPGLDPGLHRQALLGLRRINFFSGTSARIARTLHRCAKERKIASPTLLDLGCGGGEVATGIAHYFQKRGIPFQVTGWDRSPFAVSTAESRIPSHLKSAIQFQQVDANATLASRQFDFVMCSLFLHHFDELSAIEILKLLSGFAKHAVVVDDLRRTRIGLGLAYLACYGLSRSPIVQFDGPQSVRAAFTSTEALDLSRKAGWLNAKVSHHWPQRFQLLWMRDDS